MQIETYLQWYKGDQTTPTFQDILYQRKLTYSNLSLALHKKGQLKESLSTDAFVIFIILTSLDYYST